MSESRLKKDRETISGMFNAIAGKYDFLNHLLSFGIDRWWRRKLVKAVTGSGASEVLDVASGTGDVAIALDRKGIAVIGVDISERMLDIARKKAPHITFLTGDASCLDFPDNSFDAVTIAFGIRNFDKRPDCIRELLRVLKPGGLLAIAEFSIPGNRLWKALYSFYFLRILPVIGRIVSGQKGTYSYLPESSFDFPAPELFCNELAEGGFRDISFRPMTGGISILYKGYK